MPSSSTRRTRDSTATHPLNVSYLVLGLVFLGLAAMWALHAAGVVDNDQLGLLLPLTLVVAGAVGLVAFTATGVRRSRRARRRESPTPPAIPAPGMPWADDDRPAR